MASDQRDASPSATHELDLRFSRSIGEKVAEFKCHGYSLGEFLEVVERRILGRYFFLIEIEDFDHMVEGGNPFRFSAATDDPNLVGEHYEWSLNTSQSGVWLTIPQLTGFFNQWKDSSGLNCMICGSMSLEVDTSAPSVGTLNPLNLPARLRPGVRSILSLHDNHFITCRLVSGPALEQLVSLLILDYFRRGGVPELV